MKFSIALVQILSIAKVVNLLDASLSLLVVILVKIQPWHFCYSALYSHDHQSLLGLLRCITLAFGQEIRVFLSLHFQIFLLISKLGITPAKGIVASKNV